MRKHFSTFGIALLVSGGVFLSGCATMSPAMVQIVSCETYANTLTALAGYRAQHLLTPAQIATVDFWRPTLNAACASNAPSTTLLAQIEDGVLALNGLKREVTP